MEPTSSTRNEPSSDDAEAFFNVLRSVKVTGDDVPTAVTCPDRPRFPVPVTSPRAGALLVSTLGIAANCTGLFLFGVPSELRSGTATARSTTHAATARTVDRTVPLR